MMDPVLNSGMCRCCASEGTFKNVMSKYHWMGDEEIYADMLRECFDITLCSSDGGLQSGICEVCITQLRNAANFKKQVQQTEEQFKKRLQDNMFKANIVKLEMGTVEDDDGNLSDNNLSEDFVAEFEVPIKKESEEPKSKKRGSTRASTSRAKKPKLEDGESSAKNRRGTRRKGQTMARQDKLTLDKKVNFSTFIVIKPSGMTSPKASAPSKQSVSRSSKVVERTEKVVQRRLTELDLHFDNIKTVLRCSNATPIRCKVGNRYACGYCLDQFLDPRELKSHSLDVHSYTDDKPDCLSIRSLSKYSVHLDVTGLKCVVCNVELEKLESLIDHLKNEHDELIHSNIRNLIVPYKFEGQEVRCVSCCKEFADFVELQEHMSEHYKNYVCEFCDKAFIIRGSMIEHKKQVHRV